MEKNQTKLPVKIRAATDADISFIFNSWLKSFKPFGAVCAHVQDSIYFHNHHKLIERILQRTTPIVACSVEDENDIMGYIVVEVIEGTYCYHYVYVKKPFRNLGICNALIAEFKKFHPDTAAVYTHHINQDNQSHSRAKNSVVNRIAGKYALIYHPYVLMNDYSKSEK